MRHLAATVAVLAAAAAALALAPAAGAQTREPTFFDASRELLGLNGAGARAQTFDELDAMGVDVARILIYWLLAVGPVVLCGWAARAPKPAQGRGADVLRASPGTRLRGPFVSRWRLKPAP